MKIITGTTEESKKKKKKKKSNKINQTICGNTKAENKRIINIEGKQENNKHCRKTRAATETIKRIRRVFETVGLRRSTFYFKMNLYKFLRKYLLVKKFILLIHYFKNNYKLIKSVPQECSFICS